MSGCRCERSISETRSLPPIRPTSSTRCATCSRSRSLIPSQAATLFIENLMDAKPEIMIDVQEFEVDTDKTSQYGLVLPTSFEVFNVYSEIYRVLGADAPNVINQLRTTGTIDPSSIPTGDLAH